jgi:hypothetical protein
MEKTEVFEDAFRMWDRKASFTGGQDLYPERRTTPYDGLRALQAAHTATETDSFWRARGPEDLFEEFVDYVNQRLAHRDTSYNEVMAERVALFPARSQ